ncbi:hypothetical protein ACFL47_05150 [Candidatus Latescibacterota bacterium]
MKSEGMVDLMATGLVKKACILKKIQSVFVLAVLIVIPLSCSHRRHIDLLPGLVGTWKTEKGILIEIHHSMSNEAEAVIKLTPGYRGEEVEIGKVIISHIKPQPSGGFSGSFEMPEGLQPVNVDISIIMRNNLLIISDDKRLRGKKMLWKRIVNKHGY